MNLLGYENVEIEKSPIHRIGESADKLRLRILEYNDVSAVIISSMLYKGDFDGAYKKCIERFGATDTLTHWAYDLACNGKSLVKSLLNRPQ